MTRTTRREIAVIGGGAAGYFGAIACAEGNRKAIVTIYEATHQPLDKVRISGGGRCNVTHHCFDPAELVNGYPRGHRELRGPFSRFQPRDTVTWFERRGVQLKTEEDGRMFPVTDSSSTIVDCLTRAAAEAGVQLCEGARVVQIVCQNPIEGKEEFNLRFHTGETVRADAVLLASGNAAIGHEIAASLGHSIVPCVPSLFTFKVNDSRLRELSGISVPDAHLLLEAAGERFEQQGPVLITHWGLSGPAILKLSAWGARRLSDARYRAKLTVNWITGAKADEAREQIVRMKTEFGRRTIRAAGMEPIPRRLWSSLVSFCRIEDDLTWANISREQIEAMVHQLTGGVYEVAGKGVFKDEFVTCGGVSLKEIDFRSMQSRVCPGLFFAGEILDIDGITGGFNFQSAWTTGWIAGQSLAAII